jgi:hypothetical protein
MKNTLLSVLVCGCGMLHAQKNSAYFYWGYNGAIFSRSNVYLRGPDYSLSLYRAKAHDRPTKFGATYIRPNTITVPQYVARLGYFLTDRLHLSFGIDHMKYVLDKDQTLVFSGNIGQSASEKYAGSYLLDTIRLTEDFVKFEHTDGLNLVTLDIEWLQPLAKNQRKNLGLGWNFGIGGIWVATRTDSRIFGSGINNNFHVSGFAFQGRSGPRLDIGRRFFVLCEARAGFITLPWVQLRNWEPYAAEHNFFFLEYYTAVGVKHRFGRIGRD